MPDWIDTSAIALAGRYAEIPYDARPHAATHPDRLAAVAALAGHSAAPVDRCSVLEVGCSDGANLIPMALALPAARFVGCDLSAHAVERGCRTIEALGLTNITLVAQDLSTLGPGGGDFDFVVAHGVYSWVPPPVREALFALAAQRLAPHGVLYVSYNVLPGCRLRQATWDVLHHHVDGIDDARARLDAARRVARLVADGGAPTVEADGALRAEFRAIADRSDSELCHDDLALPNDPVLFDTLVRHAERHGLRYLADADFTASDTTGLSADALAALTTSDPLVREQTLDFVRLRRFRQSLFVRSDAAGDPTPPAERLAALHVSAGWALARAGDGGAVHKIARRLDAAGGGGGPVRRLLERLIAEHPAALSIAALAEDPELRGGARPLDAVLSDACRWGMVELHTQPPPLTIRPGDRPRASALARWQAASGDTLTTLRHTAVSLADRNALRLLPLVDGTRDRAALAAAIVQRASDLPASRALDFVGYALAKFARLGLLTDDAATG